MPSEVFKNGGLQRPLLQPLAAGVCTLHQRVEATKVPCTQGAHLSKGGSQLFQGLWEQCGDGIDSANACAVNNFGNGGFTCQEIGHDVARIGFALAVIDVST